MNKEIWKLSSLIVVYIFLLIIPAFGSLKNTTNEHQNITKLLLYSTNCQLNNKLDSSEFYLKNALKISEDKNLKSDKIKILFNLAELYIIKHDLEKEKIILEEIETLVLLRNSDLQDNLFNFYVLKGEFHYLSGNYNKAFSYLENARNISDKIYRDSTLIELEMYSGLAKFFLDQKKESMNYFNKVIYAGEDYMKSNSYEMLYSLYYKTCFLYNTKQQESINEITKITNKICEKSSDKNYKNIGHLYELYGSIFVLYDKNTEAITTFQKAKYFYKKNKLENDLNRITLNQAICFFNNGDYIKSKIYLIELINTNKNNSFLSHEAQFSVYTYLGLCYKNLKEFNNALLIFTESEKISKITNNEKVYVYDNIATCYKNLNNFVQAEFYYKKTLAYRKKYDPEDVLNFAKTYHNLGDLFIINKQYVKAEEYLFKSLLNLKYLNEKGRSLALLYSTFGKLYYQNGKYEKAIDYYQQSMNEFSNSNLNPAKRNTWNNANLTSAVDLLIAVKEKAKCYEEIYKISLKKELKNSNLINAIDCYKTAAWIIDTIRGGLQLEKSKLFLADNEKELYNNAIKTTYNLYSLTKDKRWIETAFEFSERSKSSLLLTKKEENYWERNSGLSFKLLKYLKLIRINIAQTEYLLYNKEESIFSDTISRYTLSEKLFDLYDKQEELLAEIKIKHPLYFNLSYKSKFVKMPELINKIKSGSNIIEYTLFDKELYIIVLSSNSTDMIRISLPESFKNDIFQLYTICSSFNNKSMGYNNYKDFSNLSNQFYYYLIKPVSDKLTGNRIIIIPDQELNFIPFEVLTEKKSISKNADYSKPDYLVKHFALSYSTSATTLNFEKTSGEAKNNLLALSPDYKITNKYPELNPIKGAKEESVNLLKIIDGHLLSDNNATETEFKKIASNYNILHLSMHCQYDSLSDSEPVLLFGNSDSLNDGKLYGWEINYLGLNASLAVLSACNTGMGKLNKGEGFLNIARTFMNAGCPTVLMTLWSIGDLSSVNLMNSFYKNISDNCQIDIALQKAKKEVIASNDPMKTHPYFWAGYILEGDTESLNIKQSNPFWFISILSTVLIVISIIIIRKRKSKNN